MFFVSQGPLGTTSLHSATVALSICHTDNHIVKIGQVVLLERAQERHYGDPNCSDVMGVSNTSEKMPLAASLLRRLNTFASLAWNWLQY